ncbi:helix-turn-helix transcriptional regulator [Actinomycetospora aeridis]|uniref:Helix-turn-helix transcriptional regulator n=1 Tax=Actinomycetospora aeridis TaxID=3129231 RepID=A0ABU8NE10_9PSEU
MGAPATPVVRSRVHTTDPDAAVSHLQGFTRFRAGPIERRGFALSLTSALAAGLGVSHLRHGTRMEAQAEPTPALTAVERRDGELTVDAGGGEIDVDLVLAPHWSRYASRWAGYLRMTTLDLAEVGRVGAEVSGLDPEDVRFDAVTPLSAARARYWASLVDHVERDLLAHDELMALPLLRQEARHRLIVGALAVFPNSTLEHHTDRGRDTGEPATIRRAVEFMDAHAGEDITVTDVADAARMGPRGLQAAFRRHRGQTPLDYLRRARMEHAHRELRAADPTGGDTVGDVAARWGFTNAGRFSVAYRRAYGCSPVETLRR